MHALILLYAKPEPAPQWFAILIASVIIIVILIRLYSTIKTGFSIVKESAIKSGVINYSDQTIENVAIHLSTFPYYQKLTQLGKEKFITRTLNFVNVKTIEGEGDFDPDAATKINIGAAATQLTFGLEDFSFPNFDNVVLYPDNFQLSEDGPLMKGATSPNGTIHISMKAFREGYAKPTDKLNVGLHELSHALFMEFLKEVGNEQGEPDEMTFPVSNVVHPYLVASDKIIKAGKYNDTFLRDYAFTNRHEFFAVSVEHFFEAPTEFKSQLPELFTVLTRLLNQDPTNLTNNYSITGNFTKIS